METFLMILIIVVFVLIVYLIIINQKTLKKVITYRNNESELKIGDQRYYELNNKIQLITVVSSIILLIGGFIGYDSINSVKKDITKDLEQYKNKLKIYNEKIIQYESILNSNLSEFKTLKSEYSKTYESLIKTKEDANILLQVLTKNKFNTNTYLIPHLLVEKYISGKSKDVNRIYYKDLLTSDKKKLPEFKNEPHISILGKGIGQIIITNIQKDYFEYNILRFISIDKKTGKEVDSSDSIEYFDLLIIESN